MMEFEKFIDPDLSEDQFSMQFEIAHLIATESGVEKIQDALDEYAYSYGTDLFWSLSSFELLEILNDGASMLSILESIEDELPRPMALLYRVRALFADHLYNSVLSLLNQNPTMEDCEESLHILLIKGLCHLAAGNYKEAHDSFEDVLLDYETPQLMIYSAISSVQLGDFDAAQKLFEGIQDHFSTEDIEDVVSGLDFINRLDLIDDDHVPEYLSSQIEVSFKKIYPTDFIFFFEMNVSELNTDYYRDVCAHIQSDHLYTHSIDYYLYAFSHEVVGHTKAAKTLYREILNTPIPSEMTDEQSARFICAKLFSLSRLGYLPRTVKHHYLRLYKETENREYSRFMLFIEADKKKLTTIINAMVALGGWPDVKSEDDQQRLKEIKAVHHYQATPCMETMNELKAVLNSNRPIIHVMYGCAQADQKQHRHCVDPLSGSQEEWDVLRYCEDIAYLYASGRFEDFHAFFTSFTSVYSRRLQWQQEQSEQGQITDNPSEIMEELNWDDALNFSKTLAMMFELLQDNSLFYTEDDICGTLVFHLYEDSSLR